MRQWVREIWIERNDAVLFTLPRDEKGIEKLIREHGEGLTALAWYEYVYADPPMYHTDPVIVAVERIGKSGKPYVDRAENTSKITKFPLASFLSGNIANDCIEAARANLKLRAGAYYTSAFLFREKLPYLLEMSKKGL